MLESPGNSSQIRGYLPRLDGLRGVAVMLVLAEHFYVSGWSLGGDGVALFFVISGFLITSILLRYSEELTFADAARLFYLRRALRLVPVYYLCIAITAMLDIGGMRQTWWLDALWLTNVRVALCKAWGAATHFWSLSVEEQFYLLWFPVVMLVPRRLLPGVIISILVTGVLYRWTIAALGEDILGVMLPGSLDSLATGALLAYASRFCRQAPLWHRFRQVRIPAMLLFFSALLVTEPLGVYSPLLVNLFCACLVSVAADTEGHWSVEWLNGTVVRHLGRISYSLYVFHYFVPQTVGLHRLLSLYWSGNDEVNRLTVFALLAAISIAIAELSWRLVEQPINRLKSRISTGRKEPVIPRITRVEELAWREKCS